MWYLAFLTSLTTSLLTNPAYADAIALTLSHYSVDQVVTVVVANNSINAEARVSGVSIDLDGESYESDSDVRIPPNENATKHFTVKLPALPGSYPLIATVRYMNDGQALSLRHVGLFHYQRPAPLAASCIAEEAAINVEGKLRVRSDAAERWRLILPEEVEILQSTNHPGYSLYQVRTNAVGLHNTYPYFAVSEKTIGNGHYAALCEGILVTGADSTSPETQRGRTPSTILLAFSLLFLGSAYYILRWRKPETRLVTALGKYASRMFLVTFSYYCLKNVDVWLEASVVYAQWDLYRELATLFIDNFRGPNYEYFFRYFVDLYWAVCLGLVLPYFYYMDSDRFLNQDKYACVLASFFSLFSLVSTKKRTVWNSSTKLGLLSIGVKLFYIPYLTSWVISNTIHQRNLTLAVEWDIYAVNAYLVALFIYLDTVVYMVGYTVESRHLKSEVRSVEPTLLGWVVCLWCYPPFNSFSFRIFDYPIINIVWDYPDWVRVGMTCVISLLWGVFAWASLALGFKASNLTNRGIVASGPYRFVRHPAYAAKLALWFIEGIFFARYGIGLLCGFTLIYFLRAWTEERHLLADADYRAYKDRVRWRFIPGLI